MQSGKKHWFLKKAQSGRKTIPQNGCNTGLPFWHEECGANSPCWLLRLPLRNGGWVRSLVENITKNERVGRNFHGRIDSGLYNGITANPINVIYVMVHPPFTLTTWPDEQWCVKVYQLYSTCRKMDIVHYTTKFESFNYSAIVEKFGHEQIFNIRMFVGMLECSKGKLLISTMTN